MHMTSAEKGFNEVLDYVKKFERVTQAGQAKILAKKSLNNENFSGSYFKRHSQYIARPIQSNC